MMTVRMELHPASLIFSVLHNPPFLLDLMLIVPPKQNIFTKQFLASNPFLSLFYYTHLASTPCHSNSKIELGPVNSYYKMLLRVSYKLH
jgi:hypothetical protein